MEAACREAARHGCLAVSLCSSRVELAAAVLEGCPVKVSALVGFPFGAALTDVKRFEVEAAIDAGAQELEFVINLGWLKEGSYASLLREMRDIREASDGRPVKAVIEMGLLSRDETYRVTDLIFEAELQFLVTATGCAPVLPSVEAIRDLRERAGPDLGVKVVGAMQNRDQAQAMIDAGANRLGVFALEPFLDEHTQQDSSGTNPV